MPEDISNQDSYAETLGRIDVSTRGALSTLIDIRNLVSETLNEISSSLNAPYSVRSLDLYRQASCIISRAEPLLKYDKFALLNEARKCLSKSIEDDRSNYISILRLAEVELELGDFSSAEENARLAAIHAACNAKVAIIARVIQAQAQYALEKFECCAQTILLTMDTYSDLERSHVENCAILLSLTYGSLPKNEYHFDRIKKAILSATNNCRETNFLMRLSGIIPKDSATAPILNEICRERIRSQILASIACIERETTSSVENAFKRLGVSLSGQALGARLSAYAADQCDALSTDAARTNVELDGIAIIHLLDLSLSEYATKCLQELTLEAETMLIRKFVERKIANYHVPSLRGIYLIPGGNKELVIDMAINMSPGIGRIINIDNRLVTPSVLRDEYSLYEFLKDNIWGEFGSACAQHADICIRHAFDAIIEDRYQAWFVDAYFTFDEGVESVVDKAVKIALRERGLNYSQIQNVMEDWRLVRDTVIRFIEFPHRDGMPMNMENYAESFDKSKLFIERLAEKNGIKWAIDASERYKNHQTPQQASANQSANNTGLRDGGENESYTPFIVFVAALIIVSIIMYCSPVIRYTLLLAMAIAIAIFFYKKL